MRHGVGPSHNLSLGRGRAKWVAAFVAAGVLLCAPSPHAAAQSDELDSQLFHPTPSPGTTFTIGRPEVARHLTFVAGLGVNVATGTFDRSRDEEPIVPWRLDAEVLAALGLFEWIELGFALPVVVSSSASNPFTTELMHTTAAGLGDVRLYGKVPLLRGDTALSARLVVSLPSGDGDRFTGTDYWTTYPSVLFAQRLGILRIGAELGWRFRREVQVGAFEWDDELQIGLGASLQVHDRVAILAEGQVRLGFAGDSFDADEAPAEVDVGARIGLTDGLTLDVGAGTGVSEGWGAPQVRAFAIVRYASEREPCEAGPEDFDGFEDGDFCADPDNDADGIEDELDECPNDAEDVDEFLDADGCPDSDNDADGVRDEVDECPMESEDRDGFEDQDGCPEPDNDQDGLEDGHDQCPMEPEDRDGFEDEDGCPEPGPERAVVTVTDTRILISERIYFDFDTETIRSVSLPLLDQVAEVIGDLPGERRIRVEGYTDDQGDAEYNLDLSYRRARAVVEYLASKGVPRDRLEYVGYGEANPVAPNDVIEGRALNRRVEFTILEPGQRTEPQRRRRRSRDD